jgi:CheY-like chemotaxis protein
VRGRVLVVDDEADVAETLRLYLESRGFLVRVALDGPAAIALLAEPPPPCVVVTDVYIPGVGGAEVARAAHLVGAQVVALTGDPDPQGVFDRVLSKPCSPRVIVAVVEELVELQATSPSQSTSNR